MITVNECIKHYHTNVSLGRKPRHVDIFIVIGTLVPEEEDNELSDDSSNVTMRLCVSALI